jgi:hypothetical protein
MGRDVVPVRLSDAERAQIESAARTQGLSFSGFVRQAALEVSARLTRKVEPVREKAEAREPTPSRTPIVVMDEPEPKPHCVDGERVDLFSAGRS